MMNLDNIRVYQDALHLAEEFAKDMYSSIIGSAGREKPFTIALSGGNTPKMLFSELAQNYHDKIPWDRVLLFWGDERCVAPYDMESNYGMARRYLLEKVPLPAENVHRIKGENFPYKEVLRYTNEINKYVAVKNDLPVFDLILLGMGEDGHTASIFPDQMRLLQSNKICAVSKHPDSGQLRITLTGPVINNATNIYFLVTGSNKAPVLKYILNGSKEKTNYPAAHIQPTHGKLHWFLDKEAAGQLNR